jgi:hypothetical protein
MDKDVKEQWLTALRSGEYKQCIGELKNPGGEHCCLGVLLQSQGWETTPYHKDNADYTYYMSPQGDINNEECELSENTRSEFGLTRPQEVHLMKLNDDKGWSFKLISKWIEDHL